MTVTNGMRDESIVRYDDRQPVHGRALLPAIAMAVGAGLVVFYIARILAERAPLIAEPSNVSASVCRIRANTRVMRRVFLAALLLLLPVAFPGVLRAQDIACDPGDLEVRAVTFNGNKHFESAELKSVIVTSASSFTRRNLHLPIGARRCLDTLELSRDAVRIRLFYRLRGYYKTAVKTR